MKFGKCYLRSQWFNHIGGKNIPVVSVLCPYHGIQSELCEPKIWPGTNHSSYGFHMWPI